MKANKTRFLRPEQCNIEKSVTTSKLAISGSHPQCKPSRLIQMFCGSTRKLFGFHPKLIFLPIFRILHTQALLLLAFITKVKNFTSFNIFKTYFLIKVVFREAFLNMYQSFYIFQNTNIMFIDHWSLCETDTLLELKKNLARYVLVSWCRFVSERFGPNRSLSAKYRYRCK